MTSAGTPGKRCYFFSPEESDADQSYKNLLGGKGANLAEMCDACLPPTATWHAAAAPAHPHTRNSAQRPHATSRADVVRTRTHPPTLCPRGAAARLPAVGSSGVVPAAAFWSSRSAPLSLLARRIG